MRLNTIVTLGASAAFGIMAIFLARSWINDAIEDEFRDSRVDISTVASVKADPTLSIVVADHDLGFGETLNPQSLRLVNYPEDAIPQGTFRSFDDIFAADTARTIVLSQMRANEPVMDYKISGPNGKGSLSAMISEGYRAAAIHVDALTGVGGFIVPGDYVDVLYMRRPDLQNAKKSPDMISDVLLQNVKVLGIDQNNNPDSQKADVASTVTLEVTNEDAQRLHLALDTGQLSLTLRGIGQTVISPASRLQASQLKPTRNTTAAWTRNKKTRAPAVKAAPSTTAQITVIRGKSRDDVTVLREQETDALAQELAGG